MMEYLDIGKAIVLYDSEQSPCYKTPKHWWQHLKAGVGYGYPPCCIAAYLLDHFIEWAGIAYRPPCALRGAIDGDRPGKRWVPCGVFHKGNPTPKEEETSFVVVGDLVKPWERLRG